MRKCICIPIEQYELMIATYDKVVAELEEMKRILQVGGKEREEK